MTGNYQHLIMEMQILYLITMVKLMMLICGVYIYQEMILNKQIKMLMIMVFLIVYIQNQLQVLLKLKYLNIGNM